MKKTIKIRINLAFSNLCELMETSPEQILQDFVDNVSLDVLRSHSEEARSRSVEYFMSMNYGTHVFDIVEIGMIFSHLEHIRQDMQKKGRVSSIRHYRELYECWHRPKSGTPASVVEKGKKEL